MSQYTWPKFLTDVIVRILVGAIFGFVELVMEPNKPAIPREDWKRYYMYPYHPDTVTVSSQIITIVLIPVVAVISSMYQYKTVEKKREGVELNFGNLRSSTRQVPETERGNRSLRYLFQADITDMLLSFTLGLIVPMTIGNFSKQLIGRPRPDFFDRCFNDATKHPNFEFFNENRMVDIFDEDAIDAKLSEIYDGASDRKQGDFVCYFNEKGSSSYKSERKYVLKEAFKSFPSGHAIAAACMMTYACLYLLGKTKALAPKTRSEAWRYVFCVLTIFPLLYMTLTRITDYRHHWEDVAFGCILGSMFTTVAYFLYYPALTSDLCNYSYRQQCWLDAEIGDPMAEPMVLLCSRIRDHGHPSSIKRIVTDV